MPFARLGVTLVKRGAMAQNGRPAVIGESMRPPVRHGPQQPITLTVPPMVFKSNGSSNGTNGTWGSNFASLSVASLGYWMDKQVRSGFAYKEQYTGGVNNGSGDP